MAGFQDIEGRGEFKVKQASWIPHTAKDEAALQVDEGQYVHWWRTKEKPFSRALKLGEATLNLFERIGPLGAAKSTSQNFFASGAAVPLAKESVNPDKETEWREGQLAETDLLPDVPDDTVIVGIVDTGIALSHQRFRMSDGVSTRFISAWQQSAPFPDGTRPSKEVKSQLPCGEELFFEQINKAIARYGNGYLDEDAFNRDLCLVEPTNPLGQRDLELAAAHGTHVLDLAAGLQPGLADADLIDRQRIIAVNLPAQHAHGSAGNFLAYFAVYAIERIVYTADELWLKNHKDAKTDDVIGYPIVINFSYGMQAGPKDGNHIFEIALREILEARRAQNRSEVRIVMPIGNNNLERCAASIVMGKNGEKRPPVNYEAKEEVSLPWRILPSDTSANFLEIWTEPLGQDDFEQMLGSLKVSVTPPGYAKASLQTMKDAEFQDLEEFARVYCQHVKIGKDGVAVMEDGGPQGAPKYRLALLVCTSPAHSWLPGEPTAPAGLWDIHIEHNGIPVDVTFFIQSDQSAVRASKTALKSYFDHPSYRRYGDDGSLADIIAFTSPKSRKPDNDDWSKFGPVQRKGTQNALSTLDDKALIAISGHDGDTFLPAFYSAVTDGDRQKSGGSSAPSLSFPSENGTAHFGILGSGAKDGSAVAFRGTSMAAGLATRFIVREFCECKDPSLYATIGTENSLRDAAGKVEADKENRRDRWGRKRDIPQLRKLKSGVGRMPFPDMSRPVTRWGGH